MNINTGNPSLQNIITRTLMGKKEKRPSFEEVFNKLSKNSTMMNTKMPLNSVLTNVQMYHCYMQNTMTKLQKSNDTFGESELNTVLMRLLGNNPSGNALTPTPLETTGGTVPLPATGGASLGTLPLSTATVLPTGATPVSTPTAPTAPITAPTVPITGIPTPPPLPTVPITTPITAPITTPTTPTGIPTPPPLPTSAPVVPTSTIPPPPPLPTQAQLATTPTGQLTLQTFGPNLPITGLPTTPPPPPPPVLPVTNLGTAFTSVATSYQHQMN